MSRAVLIARAAWLIYRLHLKADLPPPGASRFSLAPDHGFSAGGHGGVAIPVPIPNTEVKGSFAEGSAGPARARVGRRRLFLFFPNARTRVGAARTPGPRSPFLQRDTTRGRTVGGGTGLSRPFLVFFMPMFSSGRQYTTSRAGCRTWRGNRGTAEGRNRAWTRQARPSRICAKPSGFALFGRDGPVPSACAHRQDAASSSIVSTCSLPYFASTFFV